MASLTVRTTRRRVGLLAVMLVRQVEEVLYVQGPPR